MRFVSAMASCWRVVLGAFAMSSRPPWTVPPFPEIGDTHQDITFAAVGRALSQWERLEVALAGLFAAFIGIKGEAEGIAMSSYGSIVASSARGTMMNAAAEFYFHIFPNPALKKTVGDLLGEVGHYGARRNEIAHGLVMGYEVYTPPGRKPSTGCCLFPAHYNNKKIKLGVGRDRHPSYIYTSKEIDAFGANFKKLLPRVGLAYQQVAAREGAQLPPKPHGR
jgi:hypothetical protein